MKPNIEIDIKEVEEMLHKAKFSNQDIKDMVMAGAWPVITTQKLLCPWKSGDTRTSIQAHETDNVAELEIGPETDYAPHIEYGTSNPNYPIQPFVVPSAVGQSKANCIKAVNYAFNYTLREKGLI